MTTTADTHLNYDDLLRTLVDSDDLDPGSRNHLNDCPQCRHQADRLALRYHKIGQLAKTLAPSPSTSFRAPERRGAASRWQFKSAVALGMAGVLVFFLTVWWPKLSGTPDSPAQNLAQTMDDDQQLMTEIDALVENALPKEYQQLAMITDTDITDLSEDLIDWIVPSIEGTMEEGKPIG